LAYDQIVQGIADGKIKGLWVIATNSSHSWINQASFNEIASKLDFLVVQDMYASTETAARSHLVLPAAGWGEKEGTFINSERRIGLVKKVSRAPGQALADFHIFKLIAHYWGCGDLFTKWSSPEAVFQLLKKASKGQPCDISGIEDYHMLDEGGIQWPWPEAEAGKTPEKQRRLFADGKFFHQDGRAKFLFEEPRALPEEVNQSYPYTLLTGRGTSAQWHTQTRTGKSAVLKSLYPANAYVEINPEDAAALGIQPNSKVEVSSKRAAVIATAFITATVQPGQVFMPMHYATVNQLTYPAFDPYSRQPSYKACAVNIAPVKRS
jgi:assimilatory nitrate reductase catalytic subunit